MPDSLPNPLRLLGLARILAGADFVWTGVGTLRHYRDLLPQAQRLFGGDSGTTGAPMRSLLTLVGAVVLIVMGLVLIAKGLRWLGRVSLPAEGPTAITREEVIATLRDRQLLAYADGPSAPAWPIRRWLADELAAVTWWRRDIMSDGVRAFVRSCALVMALSALSLGTSRMAAEEPLGPFPLSFVIMLPFVTAIWAALGLVLLGSIGPRVETAEVALPVGEASALQPDQVIESHPNRLDQESPALALVLGATGIGIQCLMMWWWDLSTLDYPSQATTYLRHVGSIAAGVLFFLIGSRMVASAVRLLQLYRYESMLTLVEADGPGLVARAAAIRTESLGLTGPRHVVAAVGGVHVRELTERLILDSATPVAAPNRWAKPSQA